MGTFIPVLLPILKKIAINFIVSALTKKIFGKKGGRRSSTGPGTSSGILINQSGNNENINVIYGQQRVGGTRAFINTSNGSGVYTGDTQNKVLNMALILAEGEIGDLKKVYFQDKVIWDADDGGTEDSTNVGTGGKRLQGFKNSNEYNITHMAYYKGVTNQSVDIGLQTSIGNTIWDNNRKLLGLAYLACVLPWDKDYNGSAPEITVIFDGKKIRDIRASTINATNTGFSSTVYTTGADQNPADVLLDYLTDSTYGKGLPDSAIDFTAFDDAADYFYNSGTPRFKIDGFISTSQKLYDNIEEILQACNGILIYDQGKYRLQARKQNESSIFSFNTDNIIGEFNIQLTPKSSKLNKVEMTFNDSATEFNDNLVIVSNSGYKTQDNGTELMGKFETTLVSDSTVAGNIAQWIMDNSRNQNTIQFTASHTCMGLGAGAIIDITHEVVGYSAKKFRVQQIVATEDNTFEILAEEYTSSIQI